MTLENMRSQKKMKMRNISWNPAGDESIRNELILELKTNYIFGNLLVESYQTKLQKVLTDHHNV